MCGILGILPSDNSRLFSNALDNLQHRGPDGYGIWNDSDNKITLGHRRLSIIDLSEKGKQPMHYGRYVITYNGEIYNYFEIKKELTAKGHQFHTESDTEVILASYHEWGEQCLHKFNGMWAFAIWDISERKLFLARDRFGVKPLFYAYIGEKFVFASEMKAIIPFLNTVKPSSDFAWMKANIYSYESTDKCLIEGITRFPAGHSAVYQNGKLTLKSYWNLLNTIRKVPKKYSLQVEEFRELFIDACKIRMRSDVTLGTALSGGLDSSAVIATMAHISKNISDKKVNKDWQHAFVASYPGSFLNETSYALKMAEHVAVAPTFVTIDPIEGLKNIENYIYLFEDLAITPPVPMMETYRAMRKKGVVVTLDGHGADEILSGYAGYSKILNEALIDAELSIFKISDVIKTSKEIVPKNIYQYQSYYKNQLSFKKAFSILYHNRKRAIKWAVKKRIAEPLHLYEFKLAEDKLGNFNKELYHKFNRAPLPNLLKSFDRYSMASGVEIRMPFMDHRLVSYSFSLPWDSKIGGGYTKRILRDAIGPFMPDEIRYRKSKIGFDTPIAAWMQNEWREYMTDVINSKEFLESPMINGKQSKEMLEDIINKKTSDENSVYAAWLQFSVYLWEKCFLNKKWK